MNCSSAGILARRNPRFIDRLADALCSGGDAAIIIPRSRFLGEGTHIEVIERVQRLLERLGYHLPVLSLPGSPAVPATWETCTLNDLNRRGNAVLLEVFNPHFESDELHNNLKALGFTVFDCTLYTIHPDKLAADILEREQRSIAMAASLLSDQDSLDSFNSILMARVTGDRSQIARPSFEEYRHPKVDFDRPGLLVDAGAFHGSTTKQFLEWSKENHVLALEPNPGAFATLNLERERGGPKKDRWLTKCAGLWSHDKTGKLSGDGLGGRVSSEGEAIDLVSVDSVLGAEQISVLKMDIEGSEFQALMGAQETIYRQKPQLIVCLYHLIDDLWRLPLLIQAIRGDYEFYIGHHGDILYETVLYAV
ncbi:FkbM family methyltransferase [Methylocystis iwaonis]|uniref:FkbM family methyltransferase n=1 Tax=Methylocystis iwaonis TaxID=2885079 RepID=UPI002E7C46C0|nr:FkbM family methyltransferase [Methylocystis iwaonis]